MSYLESKSLGACHVEKTPRETFLTPADIKKILTYIQKKNSRHWKRDHALIYLGFYLALRVGEAAMLSRKNFRNVAKGTIYIPTLKQAVRIPFLCRDCGKKARVNIKRVGTKYHCPKCHALHAVDKPKDYNAILNQEPPEKPLPFVESFVIEYIQKYMRECMTPEQSWLFESYAPNTHLNGKHVLRIFGTYVIECGLPACYSFHALRHGRGTMLWEEFHDLVLVRDFLRHHNTITSEIYTQLSPEKNESAIKQLDKLGAKHDLSVIRSK